MNSVLSETSTARPERLNRRYADGHTGAILPIVQVRMTRRQYAVRGLALAAQALAEIDGQIADLLEERELYRAEAAKSQAILDGAEDEPEAA